MSGDRLTALQWRILKELADFEPSWTLTGGAALVGIHLQHRETRDLDLFWHSRDQLGSLPADLTVRLEQASLEVDILQSGATFARLRVSDRRDICLVDLVADPVPTVEDPLQIRAGGVTIHVDTPYEILINKLCSLLSRSEIRDLEDVQVLIESGADLDKAITDAPRKDAGFSPLTLAWVLRSLQTRLLAKAAGMDEEAAERLENFKEQLIRRLLLTSAPPDLP
jgi:hypothetical protein